MGQCRAATILYFPLPQHPTARDTAASLQLSASSFPCLSSLAVSRGHHPVPEALARCDPPSILRQLGHQTRHTHGSSYGFGRSDITAAPPQLSPPLGPRTIPESVLILCRPRPPISALSWIERFFYLDTFDTCTTATILVYFSDHRRRVHFVVLSTSTYYVCRFWLERSSGGITRENIDL